MSYRVETASSSRAGCQGTECKNAGIKIQKDELRFGAWVEIQDRGGWKWRHWGCVTGKQLENLRNYLEDPAQPGTYRWDYLDGYDGDDKNSLSHHPDLQEKVRRVVGQGFIDPEDWNGDPEMNKLGETGQFNAATKKRKRQEAKVQALEEERETLKARGESTSRLSAEIAEAKDEIGNKSEKKKAATKKRVKTEDNEEDEDEEQKPAKKKRATKVKKEEDGEAKLAKPARKSRAKKAVKYEEEDDSVDEKMNDSSKEEKPAPAAKKSRAKKFVKVEQGLEMVKGEDDFDSPAVITAPKRRAAHGKKAVKEEIDEENDNAVVEPVTKKAPAKRNRKKAIKDEPTEEPAAMEEDPDDVDSQENEANDNGGSKYDQGIMAGLHVGYDLAVAKGTFDGTFQAFLVEKNIDPTTPVKDIKAGVSKMTKSGRLARSRTTSKK